MSKQLGLMRKVDKQSPSKYVMPEIQLADTVKPDPTKEARQAKRLEQLAASFPRATPCVEETFSRRGQVPVRHLSRQRRQGGGFWARPDPDRGHTAANATCLRRLSIPVPLSPDTTSF